MEGGEDLVARLARYVHDERVLAAIASVPRQQFVPPELRDEAWENVPLPIGEGQTISQPLVVARMCELLNLHGDDRVLDVGAGSGYHAAVLARLAGRVWTIERHPALAQQARANLDAAGAENVVVVVGDGTLGHPIAAPYDAINVAAAGLEIPPALAGQLVPDGRLVMPVGDGYQRLVLAVNAGGKLDRHALEPVRFVPLIEGEPG